MLGRAHNSGLTNPYALREEILGVYESLVKECQLPTGLSHSLRTVEPFHLIPACDAPLPVVTLPDAAESRLLQHFHTLPACSMSNALGANDMIAYADAVLSAMESVHVKIALWLEGGLKTTL